MEIECIGEISPDGAISVDPSVLAGIEAGTKLKLGILVSEDSRLRKNRRGLSAGAKDLLDLLENAKPLGAPAAPRESSHSRLAEERMEEKLPWSE